MLFRDDRGHPGLLALHCSHRGADLSYGRLEDGGLRCIYHGWLYDVHGRCLEQPGEPAFSNADFGLRSAESAPAQSAIRNRHSAIKHTAYPCQEVGGLILAYLGPGEPPLVPAYCFLVDEGHRFVTKVYRECNYLQGNEGNFDSVHLAFLHRQFGLQVSYGSIIANGGYDIVDPEETDFGVRVYFVRKLDDGRLYVHNTAFCMPNLGLFGAGRGGGEGMSCNWHVPIDDEDHWEYVVNYQRGGVLQEWVTRDHHGELGPDYRPVRNKANRYLQDRSEMSTSTFAGLGRYFYAHDGCATEGAGPIQDRTQEHLGSQDKGIVAARTMLLRGIRDVQEGRDPPNVVRVPQTNHFLYPMIHGGVIPASANWRTHWEPGTASRASGSATGTR